MKANATQQAANIANLATDAQAVPTNAAKKPKNQ